MTKKIYTLYEYDIIIGVTKHFKNKKKHLSYNKLRVAKYWSFLK